MNFEREIPHAWSVGEFLFFFMHFGGRHIFNSSNMKKAILIAYKCIGYVAILCL